MEKYMTDYNTDYYKWLKEQVQLLQQKRFDEVDLDNVIEELSDNARMEWINLVNATKTLIVNLLKWEYFIDERTIDVVSNIVERRETIDKLISNSPSLIIEDDKLQSVYESALFNVVKSQPIPNNCKYTWNQLIDTNYYPGVLTTYNKQLLVQFGVEVQ